MKITVFEVIYIFWRLRWIYSLEMVSELKVSGSLNKTFLIYLITESGEKIGT